MFYRNGFERLTSTKWVSYVEVVEYTFTTGHISPIKSLKFKTIFKAVSLLILAYFWHLLNYEPSDNSLHYLFLIHVIQLV